MNNSERKIKQQLESEGWKVLRGGAPDFIALKVNEEGEITDFKGVEGKPFNGKLSYEQKIYQKIFELAGIHFEVAAYSNHSMPFQSTPDQAIPHPAMPHHSTPGHTNPLQA